MIGRAITVAELIEILKEFPQDAPVKSEGCDCDGEANGAAYYPATRRSGEYVLVTRGLLSEGPSEGG